MTRLSPRGRQTRRDEIPTLSSPSTSSSTGWSILHFNPMLQGPFFISRILQNKLRCSLNSSTPATPSLLGGRSRLHLIDFGSCERTKTLGGSITQVWNTHPVLRELTSAQAGLGNVILGVLNGQRHLPFKESRVTQLLREVLGSVSCQVCDKISIARANLPPY